MAFKPTKQQELAITKKGNILVSAAAGSGKTAVLVERVISMLTDKDSPVRADELLIVTFTNAAAAEMRSRIERRLEEECLNNPNDTGLFLQKHLLNNAKICTIDSFCIDLVRENFDKLNISTDFKICDGYSLRQFDEEVIYQIINRYLEEKNPTFLELLDIIGAEFDEKNFAEFILEIFQFSRQMPFPQKWFDSLYTNFTNCSFNKENEWYNYAIKKAQKTVHSMREQIAKAIDLITVVESAADAYLVTLFEAKNKISVLLEATQTEDWDTIYFALKDFELLKLSTARGLNGYPEVSAVKDIYKFLSEKSCENLKKLFYADKNFIENQFKKLTNPIKLLIDILKEFEQNLFEKYKQENSFTFHNTEHLALSLLCCEQDGQVIVNPDAKEFLSKFHEVMVDEYQDTNNLQDMLFRVLSNFEEKLFVVGDVKQSIYAFRGANPSNFLEKKNRYIDIENATELQPQKIVLGNNFRCKDQVCDFVNYFFSLFMTSQTGEIVYSADEELIPTANFPETQDLAVEFDIIHCKSTNEKSLTLQARQIAKYIKDTINGPACIKQDDETLRKAKYGDFTILLRSVANKAPELVSELKKQGIPVNMSFGNFAESTEISTILSLLKVLDNPQSDVQLLTVMLSPIFNFTPDELAEIRANSPKTNLYSAVIFASQNGDERAKQFLEKIEKYRLYSVTLTLPKLILKLLHNTEYLNIVSAMNDGDKRRNNLLLLCNYAEQFSNNNSKNLQGFINYILKQSELGLGASNVNTSTDSVKIMSIHASKGLQFPVCIIAATESRFNDAESRSNAVFSDKYGIGFKYFDEDDKTKYTTISREVILDDIKKSALEEELRLLYVAMTRTQDKLLFVSSFSNFEKALQGYKNLLISSNCKVDNSLFSRTKSYADWLIISLILHPKAQELREVGSVIPVIESNSRIKLNLIDGIDLKEPIKEVLFENTEIDNDIVKKIKKNISYKYPFEDLLSVQSKTSVSAVANKAEAQKYLFNLKPSFLSEGGITATERGTAMHKVMEFFDFEKYNDIESEIERLYEWQFITEREKNSLNINALKHFFESDIFERIKNAQTFKREMRFLTEIPAMQIDASLDEKFKGENVIIQGAVDICFVEDGQLVILDFKTDRVDDIEDLATAYSQQLSIYGLACQKIFEMPIKEKIIYSFSKSNYISIK